MDNELTILHYGISGVGEDWAFSLNQTTFIDRVYYILEEGAGYIENGEKKYFIKNHIYLLNHSADIEYFVENFKFRHAFIDYTKAGTLGYKSVLDISPNEETMLSLDAKTMVLFLQEEELKGRKKGAFHPYNERLMLILKSILSDVESVYQSVDVENMQIAEAIRFIHSHYSKEISVNSISDMVHLSRNQFTRLFFKVTQKTPYQYIKDYRFDMALLMLEKGMSIAEIAATCGFMSTSAFSNSFKKRFGHSPNRRNVKL